MVLGSNPESLRDVLRTATSDSAQVLAYNFIARQLMTEQNQDYSQALFYAQQGLMLAEQVQFLRGEAELYRTVGIACFYLNDYRQAIERHKTSLKICYEIQQKNVNLEFSYRLEKDSVLLAE